MQYSTENNKSGAATEEIELVPLAAIRPSPENNKLYRPVDPRDPEIVALAQSIRLHGIREPLVATLDGYIISGHRRHVAAKLAGLREVPCRREPISREDDPDGFIVLLREHNRQRIKSFDEQVREEAIGVDPEESYRVLVQERQAKSDLSGFDGTLIEIRDAKKRSVISQAKVRMLAAAINVIEQKRAYWPLSVRAVHYGMLNDPPLRHTGKPGSTYTNNRNCYKDLCDLLTRARMVGAVSWETIADENRPFSSWNVHKNCGGFIRQELDGFCKGYYRDLQQSQRNHIELVAEKLTIRSIVEPVASEFCIPTTIGRGFCSSPPRREMYQRFKKSGREKLIILAISDHDPDGVEIGHSFARSMRDDFGAIDILPVKVALTAEQVHERRLPPSMDAKKSSSNFKRFAKSHGLKAYELEALPPEDLANLLRDAIWSVMDVEAFNHEVEKEKEEAAKLDAFRRTTAKMIAGAKMIGGGE